jgi:D-lyxose ketol-isomerase
VITRSERDTVLAEALTYLDRAGIQLGPAELEGIEIADFGLGRVREVGLELVVYVNAERYCAKELVLLPRQMCPEHRHPPINGRAGKEETFRCRWGIVFLYVEGPATGAPSARVKPADRRHLTVWHEIVLRPADQWTVPPNTLHWFQAGDDGAVASEFSSRSVDASDVFTDPDVDRLTRVVNG